MIALVFHFLLKYAIYKGFLEMNFYFKNGCSLIILYFQCYLSALHSTLKCF